jgi:hypothetical protein
MSTSEHDRCDCADYLRRMAPWQAFLSRDLRRGFLSAARTLDQRAARDVPTR